MGDKISIINTTKGKLPRLPFEQIKNTSLGKNYELSVAFIGDSRARTLNMRYRKKDKIANVLSFPYSKTSGEICINVRQAAREAKKYKVAGRDYILLLFVHGILHLKGLRHGSKMESKEKRLLHRFKT